MTNRVCVGAGVNEVGGTMGGPVLVFGGRQGPLVPLISHSRMGVCVFNLSPDLFYLLDMEGRYEAKQLCVI